VNKKHFLWLIPAGIILAFLIFLGLLPSLISSTAHRATIEALAYQLTGRPVTINGNLSLNLFPEPQLIAENISIGGPDNETITAESLTLDIAVTALLRGHLSAKTLSLQSPRIKFPWPLPGGAAAIAPPNWLTTLHAQITNGTISVGALTFQSVNADIFTGANGALSVSGTGAIHTIPVTVSLALAGLDAAGSAPVSIDAAAGPASLHLSGTFNAASALAGTITFTSAPLTALGQPNQSIEATAMVQADPEQIALTKILATQGNASLSGTATLALQNPILSLTFSGANLVLPGLDDLAAASATAIPIYLDLSAASASLAGLPVPHLSTRAEFSANGANISALNATLPGNTALSLTGTLNPAGQISGHLGLNTNDFSALLAAAGTVKISAPDSWRQTNLATRISGTLTQMQFQRLSGTIGPGYMTGNLILDRSQPTPRLAGALHFDTFDLTPFTAALPVPGNTIDADLEITADRALYQNIHFTRLLIDADFGQTLTIRRFTASLYNGLAAGSFATLPNGDISNARAAVSLPSAAPLTTLIPADLQPPAAIMAAPLAAGLLAAGPPAALRTSATLTLGDFAATAAPTVNLQSGTATGPLTLRHPSAIAALKLFGLNADLAWPGAGSLSLRAGLTITPTQTGLQNFALSFGDLTATGRLLTTSPKTGIDADITADTLALPPWPTDATPLWSALTGQSGKILLTANRVLVDGTGILGPAAASLALQPNADTLTITKAALGGGNLSATLNATTAPATPPSLAVKFTLTNADAAQLAPSLAFPLTLPTGTIALSGTITAAGYGPQTWEATLAGPVNLSAKSGTLTGFNLPALIPAFATIPREPALRAAALTGASPFDTLSVAGQFDHGLYTIADSSLQSPSGAVTATGSIDLPDEDIFLTLDLHPAVPNPPAMSLTLDGPWAAPQKIPTLREALAWTATP
jgi:uncharacterized protein involved in outer membrane biogenesis